MERFAGRNLSEVSHLGRPAPVDILSFVYKACDALHHAHANTIAPVIHRDIKPSNLMTIKGDMRVLDFGIAKKLIPEGVGFTVDGQSMVGGAFSDPALIENSRLLDARSDIYGLGACWYYILTGIAPSGSNVTEQLRAINGMTREYEAVIMKCIAKLESRYPTMLELKNDVAALIEEGIPIAESEEQLDEDAMRFLGTLFGKYISEREPQTYWTMQQTLGKKLTEFSFAISLSKLRERSFVRDEESVDHNGNPWTGLAVTDNGKEWVSRHEDKISTILQSDRATDSAFSDDIPF